MLNGIFKGLFDTSTTAAITVTDFLLCLAISLLIGIFLAAVYTYKSKYTKSFVMTLALIPAVVCVVIMLVNGNIGAGVAVAGAFSLVRFRSAPGTAKEICAIFLAMGAGLVSGMGYLAYAVLFAVILGAAMLLYTRLGFGEKNRDGMEKTLQITIPESLDYTGVFEDLMKEYTSSYELIRVKTTNMGSLFKLTYDLKLKAPEKEKEFIDQLRCRNGNLEISIYRQQTEGIEL